MMHHKKPGAIGRDYQFLAALTVTGIVALTTRFTVSITLIDAPSQLEVKTFCRSLLATIRIGLWPTGIVAITCPDASSITETVSERVLHTKSLPEVCADSVLRLSSAGDR